MVISFLWATVVFCSFCNFFTSFVGNVYFSHLWCYSGALPLNLAISHAAAEIFEVIVTDSTASSLGSWIVHAMELYKALHSSPPGSNRKDAPTRLLEWIDAGVVFHKSGAVGLLRYAAVLASGGDANSNLANTLVSELTDLDNTAEPDVNVMDNLGKTISEKTFDGITLRDPSIAQLTTAFQILAYISENSVCFFFIIYL